LVLVLFGAQMLVHLYATSVLAAATERAAQLTADASNLEAEAPAALAEARSQLGTWAASHVSFIFEEVDSARVVLRASAYSPGFLPLPASWREITRTASVPTEAFRP
jgi:hypothetical protein